MRFDKKIPTICAKLEKTLHQCLKLYIKFKIIKSFIGQEPFLIRFKCVLHTKFAKSSK